MDKPFTVVTLANNTEYTHTLLFGLIALLGAFSEWSRPLGLLNGGREAVHEGKGRLENGRISRSCLDLSFIPPQPVRDADTALLALFTFAQSLLSTGSCQIIRTATFTDFPMNESTLMAPDAPSGVSLLDPCSGPTFRSTVATCDSRSKRWLLLVFRGIDQSRSRLEFALPVPRSFPYLSCSIS